MNILDIRLGTEQRSPVRSSKEIKSDLRLHVVLLVIIFRSVAVVRMWSWRC